MHQSVHLASSLYVVYSNVNSQHHYTVLASTSSNVDHSAQFLQSIQQHVSLFDGSLSHKTISVHAIYRNVQHNSQFKNKFQECQRPLSSAVENEKKFYQNRELNNCWRLKPVDR